MLGSRMSMPGSPEAKNTDLTGTRGVEQEAVPLSTAKVCLVLLPLVTPCVQLCSHTAWCELQENHRIIE